MDGSHGHHETALHPLQWDRRIWCCLNDGGRGMSGRMKRALVTGCLLLGGGLCAADLRDADYGSLLRRDDTAAVWTCASGWKVGRTKAVPSRAADGVTIRCARNEAEAAQLVVTPARPVAGLTLEPGGLTTAEGATIPASCIDILRVGYVNIAQATDRHGATGPWPDPLLPRPGPLDLTANENQPFWIRVTVPENARAGTYTGSISLAARGWKMEVPLRVEVHGFALPAKSTCETAFGFSPHNAFRYHGATTEVQKRQVLELYWRTFAAHRIAPYDPAPLDPIRVMWPDVKPPPLPWHDWHGGRIVTNETHGGRGALAIFDDNRESVLNAYYQPLLAIPAKGLRLRFAYRTALPGHELLISFGHYDAQTNWMSGCNNDITVSGNGHWQTFDRAITRFPDGAKFVQLRLYGTTWTDAGEKTGLTWFDDVAVNDPDTGAALVRGGDFEPPPPRAPVAPPEQLQPRLDFTAWDREMTRVLSLYRFNSFRLHLEGMGGGTYEGFTRGQIRGFGDDTPEYEIMFGSYVRQLEQHLREKGWLDLAYVYWFDEPDESQYGFVRGGFERLRTFAPGLRGLLTEQVEPGLIGGPSLWCPISNEYRQEAADARRRAGEHFWWYICCGPKAPFATEFIDHPGTSLRAWLWQTWQRRIEGVLIWESNYWTSPTAYPDRDRPQNPYEDPMSWVSGGKPGAKHPWGNGDGRFLYPPEAGANGRPGRFIADAPVDSIRWEMLRDGVEDYEYLAILRRLLAERGAKLDPARRDELQKLLDVPAEISGDVQQFTHDPAPIEARRLAIARAIEALK